MGKLMMLIWMMIGDLTMSEAVSRMPCWSHANWQLPVNAEMHGSYFVAVCPTVCKLTARWQANAQNARQILVSVVSTMQVCRKFTVRWADILAPMHA